MVRGRVGVGVRVRVRVRVGVGWGLCRYLGLNCAKTSCKNSLQARPANRCYPDIQVKHHSLSISVQIMEKKQNKPPTIHMIDKYSSGDYSNNFMK